MTRVRSLFAAAVIAFACLSHASSAHAQWPWLAFSPMYGTPASANLAFQSRTPPYFAIHPPVYYSGAITRVAYGSSPYAFMQPVVQHRSAPVSFHHAEQQSSGMMIENPYYSAQRESKNPSPMPFVPNPALPSLSPLEPPSVLVPPVGAPALPPASGVLPAPIPGVKPAAPKPMDPNVAPSEAGKTVVNPFVSPSRT